MRPDMQETFYQQPFVGRMMAPFKPSFKLFIACEDQAAFFQARKVEEQVRALCENDIEISRVFWSFSLLRYKQFREHAASEAAAAKMIIIALNGSNELPPHVKSLLEGLPVRPQRGESAMVALIGADEETEAEPPQHVPYLRELAQSRGLDFFCNQDGWERLDLSKPSFAASGGGAMAAQTIISCHIPWTAGAL